MNKTNNKNNNNKYMTLTKSHDYFSTRNEMRKILKPFECCEQVPNGRNLLRWRFNKTFAWTHRITLVIGVNNLVCIYAYIDIFCKATFFFLCFK